MKTLPPWRIELRHWQAQALGWWGMERPDRALAVVTPGGGKSLFAASVAYGCLSGGHVDGIIVVVPSDHLRTQLALSFASGGVELDPNFRNADRIPARDVFGPVVTYHQVVLEPGLFASLIRRRRYLVVLDEIHHAGSDARWGVAVERAFGKAPYLLALSGTPFRSDKRPVSFLTYDTEGRIEADIVYGYREGLRDHVVRPLVFHPQGGEIEWIDNDGIHRRSFEEKLTDELARRRLRAALLRQEWIDATIAHADSTLRGLRQRDRDAGALAVAIDERHARFVADRIATVTGRYPIVVTSTDVAAGTKIAQFARGTEPWLVAIRMVTEGIDIPRARVLAYLTTARTEMFFRQMVGRIVRAERGEVVPAFAFFPDDPVLRAWAMTIEEEVHRAGHIGVRTLEPVAAVPSGEGGGGASSVIAIAAEHRLHAEIVGDESSQQLASVEILPPPSQSAAHPSAADLAEEPPLLAADRRAHLRREFNKTVHSVCKRFGIETKQVYAYWVRRDGRHVNEASSSNLEKRIRSMERWLGESVCPIG